MSGFYSVYALVSYSALLWQWKVFNNKAFYFLVNLRKDDVTHFPSKRRWTV